MRTASTTCVDFIKELRLRRWARDHYVPAAMRQPDWHPVVLDEMTVRDRELEVVAREPSPQSPLIAYVPLMPDREWILHAPHRDVPRPAMAARMAVEESIFIPG